MNQRASLKIPGGGSDLPVSGWDFAGVRRGAAFLKSGARARTGLGRALPEMTADRAAEPGISTRRVSQIFDAAGLLIVLAAVVLWVWTLVQPAFSVDPARAENPGKVRQAGEPQTAGGGRGKAPLFSE